MSDPRRPSDLIPLEEAARVAERSERTLRRWLAAKSLTRWEGDSPPDGGSAPTLISRGELLAFLVSQGQAPRRGSGGEGDGHGEDDDSPNDSPRQPLSAPPVRPGDSPSEDVAALRLELERARGDLQRAALEGELAAARAAVERARLEGRVAALEAELEGGRDLVRALRQDLAAARLDLEDWRGRHDAREAELRALREEKGIPWWRRLLGSGRAPTGEGNTGEER